MTNWQIKRTFIISFLVPLMYIVYLFSDSSDYVSNDNKITSMAYCLIFPFVIMAVLRLWNILAHGKFIEEDS